MSVMMGTDIDNVRHWTVAGADDSNGWGSGWKLFVIDPLSVGTSTIGTYDPGSITEWGLWMDVTASVRADSIFIDQIAIAHGIEAHSGSGTLEEIITYAYGTLPTRVIGSYTYSGRFNYVTGPTYIGDSVNASADTLLTATSQINGYNVSEYWNGTTWVPAYPIDSNKIILEKHVSFLTSYTGANTSMFGNSLGELYMSKDIGATYEYNGGTFELLAPIIHDSDWNVQNANFSECGTRDITGGIFENNKVQTSDLIIVSGGTFTGNSILLSTSASSIVTNDLALVPGNHFESDGANHAVELTTIGAGSMSWSNTSTSYDAGVTGSPITPTSTGNEDIYINVATASDITINVAAGASTPSIRVGASFTGNVNVVAGLVSVTFTVSPSVANYEYTLYTVTASGSLVGAVEVQHVEDQLSDNFAYTYTFSVGVILAVQLLFGDGSINDYEESLTYYTLGSSDASQTINLKSDINN